MEGSIYPQTFAVINKDENVRRESRSGGVFTALSNYIMEEEGAVYGAILKDNIIAEHVRATDSTVRDAMRGSKYIQSSTKNTFKEVQEDLSCGKKVLYTGTSCQIAGLRGFLKKSDCENLYCVDIVCHGVPSPLIWKEYIRYLEKKLQAECTKVDFRDKKTFGWTAHYEKLSFQSNVFKRKKIIYSDTFKNLFYDHYILRPSCYRCPYKSIMHPGDITIADYWGVQKAAPDFFDNKGVSLVLINNEKGEKLFKRISSVVRYKSTRIEDSMQPPLQAPFPKPEDRGEFWKYYHEESFELLLKKYSHDQGIEKLINRLRIIKKAINSPSRR